MTQEAVSASLAMRSIEAAPSGQEAATEARPHPFSAYQEDDVMYFLPLNSKAKA